MHILTCPNCGKECGYYLGTENLEVFCSSGCLVGYGFPYQSHDSKKRKQSTKPAQRNLGKSEICTDRVPLPGDTRIPAHVPHINGFNKNLISNIFSELGISELIDTNGKIFLTKTQFKILQFLVTGKSNQEIAAELYVAKRSVESHVRGLLSRFGLSNRTKLVIAYLCNPSNVVVDADRKLHDRTSLVHENIRSRYLGGIDNCAEIAKAVNCSVGYVRYVVKTIDPGRTNRKHKEPIYQKIRILYLEGIEDPGTVADIIKCSRQYANIVINRLKQEEKYNFSGNVGCPH